MKKSNIKKMQAKELMKELTKKLVINLNKNELLCPECKGLRMKLVEKNDQSFMKQCVNCNDGKNYICDYCNKINISSYCGCKESMDAVDEQYRKEKFDKANKINFDDYDGYFVLNDGEYAKNKTEILAWLYEEIKSNKPVPRYLWATTGEGFNLNIKDAIDNECGDYDIYNRSDMNTELLEKHKTF